MVWSALIYTTIVIVIVIFPLFNVSSVKNKDLYKLIRKIGNLLFYSLGKVLSGPIIGLAINILYCDSGNVDQAGNVCYSP